MAVYTLDFGSEVTGQAPSGLTERDLGTAHTSSVIEGGEYIGGKGVTLSKASTSYSYFSIDALDSDPDRADCEFLAKLKLSAGDSEFGFFLVVRGDGVGNKYILATYGDTALSLKVASGGNPPSQIWLDNVVPTTIEFDIWPFWIRFKLQGTQLQVRGWSVGEEEPDTWDASYTDTDLAAAGYVGFGTFGSNLVSTLDYLSVGTGIDQPLYTEPAVDPATNLEVGKTYTTVAVDATATTNDVLIGKTYTTVAVDATATTNDVLIGKTYIALAVADAPAPSLTPCITIIN